MVTIDYMRQAQISDAPREQARLALLAGAQNHFVHSVVRCVMWDKDWTDVALMMYLARHIKFGHE